jgi:hypothetical protein
MRRIILAIVLALAACATTGDEGPSADELDDLDAWAQTADGKADLPNTWAETVAWLRDVYTNRMSAIWNHQEHPATADAALTRIRGLLAQAGVTDLSRVKLRTHVQRLRTDFVIDHSEIDIQLPGGTVIRLVGDPKGAGAFVDRALFKTSVGPALCLTWNELDTAVRAAYVPGHYAVDFVCHTVTERVLRALEIGTAPYSGQVRTYQAARYIWGPVLPSFHSQDPADWPESRSCD